MAEHHPHKRSVEVQSQTGAARGLPKINRATLGPVLICINRRQGGIAWRIRNSVQKYCDCDQRQRQRAQ
jgi:hypothetical protein